MFSCKKKAEQFIFSSRKILGAVSDRLNCNSKFRGFANLLPQHENVELKAAMYVTWCEELIIHINRNWTIKDLDYPIDCINCINAVLHCYTKGQSPNVNKWISILSKK